MFILKYGVYMVGGSKYGEVRQIRGEGDQVPCSVAVLCWEEPNMVKCGGSMGGSREGGASTTKCGFPWKLSITIFVIFDPCF